MSNTLQSEIRAYNNMRLQLESDHLGKWVVFHDQKLQGTYDSFEDAAANAVECFARGPYLIRRVGASSVQLPVSLLYRGSIA